MVSYQKSSCGKRFLTKNNTHEVLCGCANFSAVFFQSLYKHFQVITVSNEDMANKDILKI